MLTTFFTNDAPWSWYFKLWKLFWNFCTRANNALTLEFFHIFQDRLDQAYLVEERRRLDNKEAKNHATFTTGMLPTVLPTLTPERTPCPALGIRQPPLIKDEDRPIPKRTPSLAEPQPPVNQMT